MNLNHSHLHSDFFHFEAFDHVFMPVFYSWILKKRSRMKRRRSGITPTRRWMTRTLRPLKPCTLQLVSVCTKRRTRGRTLPRYPLISTGNEGCGPLAFTKCVSRGVCIMFLYSFFLKVQQLLQEMPAKHEWNRLYIYNLCITHSISTHPSPFFLTSYGPGDWTSTLALSYITSLVFGFVFLNGLYV